MLGPYDGTEGAPEPQSRDTPRLDVFTPREIARMMELRDRYLLGELNELCTESEHRRLVFARWLYEHDRLAG